MVFCENTKSLHSIFRVQGIFIIVFAIAQCHDRSFQADSPFTNPHTPHNIKKRKIAGAALRSSAEYITERRGKMNENDKCSTDGLTIPRGRFPQDTPIAMAYVPYQEWEDTYAENVALAKGTIFPSLDMPFLGKEGVAQYGK